MKSISSIVEIESRAASESYVNHSRERYRAVLVLLLILLTLLVEYVIMMRNNNEALEANIIKERQARMVVEEQYATLLSKQQYLEKRVEYSLQEVENELAD